MAKVQRERDISTRLIRPTLAEIRVDEVLEMGDNFDPNWENDAQITVFNEGIGQFPLVGARSHSLLFAALILGKSSLKCTIVNEEPPEELGNRANAFRFVTEGPVAKHKENVDRIERLKEVLAKRGYKFANEF
ncbi:hypothetical protein M3Y99_00786800 [Aphelenchoides fujianensis]|nr:hypothetical protein M3Y99_00786800 [Aphelenchoides fujianensis]